MRTCHSRTDKAGLYLPFDQMNTISCMDHRRMNGRYRTGTSGGVAEPLNGEFQVEH